jgi:L-asparaginase
MNSSFMKKVVVLGTGGTIAGLKDDPKDPNSYQAGQVPVADLVSKTTPVSQFLLESRQIAQIDSKDMSHAIWSQLLLAVEACMQEREVIGVLITHGTDTMEETAYLLARLIKPTKPVVLTGAMKPFDAEEPDGPINMRDALLVIQELSEASASCVCVVIHGVVHSPYKVQKLNLQNQSPFYSMPAPAQAALDVRTPLGPLSEQARKLAIELGGASVHKDSFNWGSPPALSAFASSQALPRVEIVMSHSSMGEHTVLHTLLAELNHLKLNSSNPSWELKGLVLVGPGAGNLNQALYAPLVELLKLGVRVVVTHRAPWGTGGRGIRVNFKQTAIGSGAQSEEVSVVLGVSELTPVKARIALMLSLMA